MGLFYPGTSTDHDEFLLVSIPADILGRQPEAHDARPPARRQHHEHAGEPKGHRQANGRREREMPPRYQRAPQGARDVQRRRRDQRRRSEVDSG